MKSALLRSPGSLLIAVLLLLSLPLLVLRDIPNYSWDETNYHVPAVRQIAGHWPRLDLIGDSLSATAPGYHYVLATVGQLTGTRLRTMRAINFVVSSGVIALLVLFWNRRGADSALAIAAILPLAASNFFVKSASCLVTDNAALLCVAGALTTALFCGQPSPTRLALWGFGATAVRQSNVWLAGLGAVAAIATPGSPRRRVLMVLAAIAPIGALAILWSQWHGPAPPIWRDQLLGRPDANAAAPAVYLLSLIALMAPAYFFAAGARIRTTDWLWLGAGAAGGLLVATFGPTNFDYAAGRWGGYLWDASKYLPLIGRRSLLFLTLCPLGGAVLVSLVRALRVHCGLSAASVWLGGGVCWASTLIVNQQAFHRYYEPTLLLFLVCWLLLMSTPHRAESTRARGLWLLGAVQIALTVSTAHARAYGII
jgi:hypothetical protein